jgi:hypothetical protein
MKRRSTKWLLVACLAGALASQAGAVPCADCDLDSDGKVGFSDLVTMLGDWGFEGRCVSDIDRDGKVAYSDLTCLLSRYGAVCD